MTQNNIKQVSIHEVSSVQIPQGWINNVDKDDMVNNIQRKYKLIMH